MKIIYVIQRADNHSLVSAHDDWVDAETEVKELSRLATEYGTPDNVWEIKTTALWSNNGHS